MIKDKMKTTYRLVKKTESEGKSSNSTQGIAIRSNKKEGQENIGINEGTHQSSPLQPPFKNENYLEYFLRIGGSFMCKLCPHIASVNSVFADHIFSSHQEISRYQCKFCFQEFYADYKCVNHIKGSHYEELKKADDKCYNEFIHHVRDNLLIEVDSNQKYFYEVKHQNNDSNDSQDDQQKDFILDKSNCFKNSFFKAKSSAETNMVRSRAWESDEEQTTENEPDNEPAICIDLEEEDDFQEEYDAILSEEADRNARGENDNVSLMNTMVEGMADDDDDIIILDSDNENDIDSIAQNDLFIIPPSSVGDYDFTNDNHSSESMHEFQTIQIASSSAASAQNFSGRSSSNPKPTPKRKKKQTETVNLEQNVGVGFQKPMFSYSQLIYLAFKNSVDGNLFVSQIYLFIMDHFPHFRTAPKTWKNSIRHTLCGSKCFLKSSGVSTVPGDKLVRKNTYWTLSTNNHAIEKMESDIAKMIKRCGHELALAMSRPEILPQLEQGGMKKQYSRFGLMVEEPDGIPISYNMDDPIFTTEEHESDSGESSLRIDSAYSTAPAVIPPSSTVDNSSHFRLVGNDLSMELQEMPDNDTVLYYLYEG